MKAQPSLEHLRGQEMSATIKAYTFSYHLALLVGQKHTKA